MGEEVLPVPHALIVRPRAWRSTRSTAVISHPQALAQCRRYLAEHLPGRRLIAATSTAEAVRAVADAPTSRWPRSAPRPPPRSTAATSCARAIEDEHGNETRFVWLAARRRAALRRPTPARRAQDLDRLPRRGRRVARLARALPVASSPFRGINLTRIESRPLQAPARALPVPRRPRGQRRRTRRRRGDRAACTPTARSSACSGSYPGRRRWASWVRTALIPCCRVLRFRQEPRVMTTPARPPHTMRSTSPDEHRRRGRDGGRVLVLNASYEPINVCTVRRAVVLLLKAKAEVVDHATWELRSERATMSRPRRDPADDLHRGPARHSPPQDHPPRGLRPRQLDLPVLRLAVQPDRRPRDPPLQGRRVDLGQHRRLLRAVQPPQGRPPARQGGHAPRRTPSMPQPHVFIHVATPTIPAAWRQWLPEAA